jgi:hypothetical protein
VLDLDLEMPANVILMPPRPRSGGVSIERSNVTLVSAIRYVVEAMPPAERPRAVIQTAQQSMFIAEIQAIYDQPGFPRAYAKPASH